MEHVYQCGLIEEQFLTRHKRGYFVVFYYPAGRGKEKECWLGVLFLILGIVISESLEWCKNPVSLRIATELSGVIMGYV